MSMAEHDCFQFTLVLKVSFNFLTVVSDIILLQLYDWIQEHEQKVLNIFHQFDPDEDGRRNGKITRDNFVMCLQTISKYM